MAEWSNAAVLKTVEGHTSGGSNPSFSAEEVNPLKTKGLVSKSKQKSKQIAALQAFNHN